MLPVLGIRPVNRAEVLPCWEAHNGAISSGSTAAMHFQVDERDRGIVANYIVIIIEEEPHRACLRSDSIAPESRDSAARTCHFLSLRAARRASKVFASGS